MTVSHRFATVALALMAFASVASAQFLMPGERGKARPTGLLSLNGANCALGSSCNIPTGSAGGRITLTSGACVMTSSVSAATTIYYAPCGFPYVPIFNGTSVQAYQFTSSPTDTVGQSIALGSNWAASTIYDVFEGLNGSTPTLCTGPAWSNSGAGSSARGTGAGTTQLSLYSGMFTNAVSMTCRLSNTATFTCLPNQCTYLGSFLTTSSTGQTQMLFGSGAAGGGQAAAFVWNMYNRVAGTFFVTDTNASWSASANTTYQPLDASTTNRISLLSGTGTDSLDASSTVVILVVTSANGAYSALGLNSTSTPWGPCASGVVDSSVTGSNQILNTATGLCRGYPVLGLNFLQALQYVTLTTAITYETSSGLNQGLSATWWW